MKSPFPPYCPVLIVSCLLAGCGSSGTSVEVPDIDPSAAAAAAFEQLDGNQDAVLDAAELASAPGLAAAKQAMDQDGDGAISREELEKRLQTYVDAQLGAQSLICIVRMGGRPLPDATVTLNPVTCLEGVLKPATGITGRDGTASMIIEDEEGRIPGVQPGIYRVEISRRVQGKESIPARYNERSELGHEVSFGPEASPAVFDLKP